MSDESAAKTIDLHQTKEDADKGVKIAKSFGITEENIHVITDIESARTISKEIFGSKGYKYFKPHMEGTGSMCFVYMAGHGAHDGK